MPEATILHLALPADWNRALQSGIYSCHSLNEEGFIHACLQEQLSGVIQRHFSGLDWVWLLRIDPAGLDVRFEKSSAGIFPHIWQALPLSAVKSCMEFPLKK